MGSRAELTSEKIGESCDWILPRIVEVLVGGPKYIVLNSELTFT